MPLRSPLRQKNPLKANFNDEQTNAYNRTNYETYQGRNLKHLKRKFRRRTARVT